jgi:hypothetical protein
MNILDSHGLIRLNAQELENKNMAWVPKKSVQVQDKDNVLVSNSRGTIEGKKKQSHSIGSVIFVHGREEILLNAQLSFRRRFPNDVNVGNIVGRDNKNRMAELLSNSGLDSSGAETLVPARYAHNSAINKNSRLRPICVVKHVLGVPNVPADADQHNKSFFGRAHQDYREQ